MWNWLKMLNITKRNRKWAVIKDFSVLSLENIKHQMPCYKLRFWTEIWYILCNNQYAHTKNVKLSLFYKKKLRNKVRKVQDR